ncbi:MAG: hemolysin family protein [Methylobacterium sp.]|uniref:hemolysin family protein n=1 Tax=unclassified Methylobacterium TaxID=2615210 RepID=UPI0006F269EC|nr:MULTISPECIES: hemolysin family protein [unclassified Methylobacterium]KQP08220.1 hemolysin [Methylobacterium sp. Leaf99]MDO9428723.1 hemolysin family protein [Methylobacterium sp.]TXM71409.1 HlyC/CorC family transporter [Methylobacterium sp. WL69]
MSDQAWATGLGLVAVLVLVLANGFFVAAEFALVSVRRSRVSELVTERRTNATALQRATDQLDAHLAATQLGITISSLALGWVGEPALAHLIEPLLAWLPSSVSAVATHTIAVAISFVIITALHIVLGELAPKSLALQRSERTALAVVRPLSLFLFVFRPAILFLNGLGNGVVRLCGLKAGHGEGSLHSTAELNLLIQASQEAGLIREAQQEAVERIFSIGERKVRDIITPRHEVEWVDADDDREAILKAVRECDHAQIVVSRSQVDEIVGVVRKQDLLNQVLDGGTIDVLAATQPPTVVHESLSILAVLEIFQAQPVRMAIVVDEYGSLEGIVTQTDLLEAIAGDIPEIGDEPAVVERGDGSLLIDGMMPAGQAFERLAFVERPDTEDFATLAGFVIFQLGRIPSAGDHFETHGWRFEVVDMDGRRVDKVLATPIPA